MLRDWNCLSDDTQISLSREALAKAASTIAHQAEILALEMENGHRTVWPYPFFFSKKKKQKKNKQKKTVCLKYWSSSDRPAPTSRCSAPSVSIPDPAKKRKNKEYMTRTLVHQP